MNKLHFTYLVILAQLRCFAITGKLMHNTNTDLIYAQAILESARFKSPIFIENNNFLGLKHPSKRPTTSIGSNRGHAKYKNHFDCLTDYFLRQTYFKVKDTNEVDEYLGELLRTKYAEDKSYFAKIKQIYSETSKTTV